MSFAVDDENRFYVAPYSVSAQLELYFDRGQLIVEVGSDVRRVELSPKDAKALSDWLDQNVGE